MTAQDTQIPEDIDQIASDIVRSDYSKEVEPDYALYRAIARAILAERHRYASLAEQKIYPWSIAAGEELHDAIMCGERPSAPKGGEA